MTEKRLKDAFGETPLSVQYRVKNALNGPKEETHMKKLSVGLVCALLVVALLGGAAIAGTQWGVLDFLGWRDNEGNVIAAKQIAAAVQTVGETYDGEAVKINVTDAVYDNVGKAYTLAWTLENKTPGTEYYVFCDGIAFDGQEAFMRSMTNVSEFFLDDRMVECGTTGEVPENGGKNVEMTFTILKPLAEIVEVGGLLEGVDGEVTDETEEAYLAEIEAVNAEGKIALAGDYFVELGPDGWNENETYPEALVRSGKFETVDHFTLSFPLKDDSMDEMKKTCVGETDFKFEGYELHVRKAEMTPLSACFKVDFISDEKPGDGGKGVGPLWEIDFAIDDGADHTDEWGVPYNTYWYLSGGGNWSDDPVQLEDGRWLSTFEYEMLELRAWPDEVKMYLVTYDEELSKPVLHLDDIATLKFE